LSSPSSAAVVVEPLTVAVAPPGSAVTVYDSTAPSVSEAGGNQETDAEPLPADATTSLGAPVCHRVACLLPSAVVL
jgi:hypothetical protein